MSGLQPVRQSVYPEKGSLDEALAYAQVQLPITDPNTLYSVLMTYQNTLLKTQQSTKTEH